MSQRLLFVVALASIAMSIGCRSKQCNDCSDGFGNAIPMQVGTYSRQWHSGQVVPAMKQQSTFYLCDWVGETAELSPFGKKQIRELVNRIDSADSGVYLETSNIDELDMERKVEIAREFAQLGIHYDIDSITSVPLTESLHGEQAPAIASKAFNSTRNPRFGAPSSSGVGQRQLPFGGFGRPF